MATPEQPEGIGEIKLAEGLRDIAWEYLPTKAREAQQLVEVTYWPVGAGVVKLTVKYDPHDKSLDIDTEETVNTSETEEPDSFRKFMHYRGIELNAETGEVVGYGENADVRDEYDRIIESPEEVIESDAETYQEWLDEHNARQAADAPLDGLETDAFYTFTQDKLDYLQGLFDKI